MQLPSGTVTFVFSDIEGSVRRWQENEVAMRAALALHDTIIRSGIATHSGYVIKHTGDGMIAVFARAADAIGATVDAQRALREADWGPLRLVVRMAVHSGEAHERDGDYFGPTLNRAARLLAIANGGQVLVSSAAAALAREGIGPRVTFRDVGEHRLRDLDMPERVLQVCADGLEREFPPLRSATNPLRGFPAMRSRTIGREALLAEIAQRLDGSSLLTLTGVGGSGKTRLAIEAGRQLGPRLPDGATFVDLSPLGDAGLIAQTVAAAVGMPTAAVDSREHDAMTDALLAYLSDRHMLVVLDNCEHLIDGVAETVSRLFAACPNVRLLVTSREGLSVQGESMLAVPSLELPSEDVTAADSSAVQLLVERAAAVGAAADLVANHEPAIVDICRRLDGIPLALELAAVQLAHLTPEEVAQRLDDRFRLLAGTRRHVRRQATLQATVEWSYQLLSELERVLLARLSVFAGGFPLDAAEGVCTGEGIEARQIVSLLGALVAKSLVVADTYGRVSRYRLLETIRAYAGERLVERREGDVVRARHRDWFLDWAERLDSERHCYPGLRRVSHLLLLESEVDNLRSALAWSEGEKRMDAVARLAVSVDVLWGSRCYQDEGLRWMRILHGERLCDGVLAARCATLEGWLTMQRGHFARMPEHVRAALDSAKHADLLALGRPEAIGPLLLAGTCQAYGDRAAGRALVGQACEIAEKQGLHDVASAARGYEGRLWLTEGRYDEAAAVLQRVVDRVDLEQPRYVEAFYGAELAIAHHLAGRHHEALRAATICDALAVSLGEPWTMMMAPATLALVRAGRGLSDGLLPELLDLLRRARRDRLPVVANYLLTVVAAVLALKGCDEAASTVLAAAGADIHLPFRTPGHYAVFRHYGRLLHRRLGNDVARRCREAGSRLSLDAAGELARSVAGIAGVARPG